MKHSCPSKLSGYYSPKFPVYTKASARHQAISGGLFPAGGPAPCAHQGQVPQSARPRDSWAPRHRSLSGAAGNAGVRASRWDPAGSPELCARGGAGAGPCAAPAPLRGSSGKRKKSRAPRLGRGGPEPLRPARRGPPLGLERSPVCPRPPRAARGRSRPP